MSRESIVEFLCVHRVRIAVWSVLFGCLVVFGCTVGGSILSTLRLEEAITASHEHILREQHEEVVGLLQERLNQLEKRPTILALFARSRLQVPMKGNRHVAIAIRAYRGILRMDPKNREATTSLFRIYRGSNSLDLACRFGLSACKLEQDNTRLYVDVGDACLKNEQFDDALQLAEKALKIDPSSLAAAKLKIQVMLAQNVEPGQIRREFRHQLANDVLQLDESHILLTVAKLTGDRSEVARLADSAADTKAPLDRQQAKWLAIQLEEEGRPEVALRLLEDSASQDGTGDLLMPLAYRYFQAAEYVKLHGLSVHETKVNTAPAELLVLRALAYWQAGDEDAAKFVDENLCNIDSQLARTWVSVLDVMLATEQSPQDLLDAAAKAGQLYPENPYLEFITGVALNQLNEADRAKHHFRLASEYAKRWVNPRIELARVLITQRQFLTAAIESSVALRLSPQNEAAYDTFLASVLEMIAVAQPLPPDLRKQVEEGLSLLQQATTDERSLLSLRAMKARLDGDTAEADACVKKYLTLAPELDSPEYRVLSLLVTSPELALKLQANVGRSMGPTLSELVTAATRMADEQTDQAAIDWLADKKAHPQISSAIVLRLATARFLTLRKSEQAANYWRELIQEHHDSIPILQMADESPALAQDFTTREQIVRWMKDASGELGVVWRLAEVRLMMDEDSSVKTAAACSVKLAEILKVAPTSAMAFAQQARAYSRLKQIDKAAQTLEEAIAAGVDNAEFRIRLANFNIDDRPEVATEHALQAHGLASRGSPIRLQALDVLLELKNLPAAARLARRDVPEELTDTDVNYKLMAVVAISNTDPELRGKTAKAIQQLAPQSDRWFNLWLDFANVAGAPLKETIAMLEHAESWLTSDERHRRLSHCWRRLGRRDDRPEYWKPALRVLQPILDSSNDAGDWLIAGRLYELTDEHQQALHAFRKAISLKTTKRQRVLGLSSLARIQLTADSPDLEAAGAAIQEALQLDKQAELVVTLARIHDQKGTPAEAVRILAGSLDDYPKHIALRLQLTDLYLRLKQTDQAEQVLRQLQKLSHSSTFLLSDWQNLRALKDRLAEQKRNPL